MTVKHSALVLVHFGELGIHDVVRLRRRTVDILRAAVGRARVCRALNLASDLWQPGFLSGWHCIASRR